MATYSITDTGKNVVRQGAEDAEKLRVLEYVMENRMVSNDDLEFVGESWIPGQLARRGLLKKV